MLIEGFHCVYHEYYVPYFCINNCVTVCASYIHNCRYVADHQCCYPGA